jgi:YgiT-type zinc finger domain-containing protein
MICLICRQAKLVGGLTTVQLERGEIRLVVNDVPARICPDCGEAYLDVDVAERLLQTAEDRSSAGKMDEILEYGSV